MYLGDHLVLSTGLAVIASRRWSMPFVPLATALILLNMIDFDHLLNYTHDDGTANSLTLYPLHIYAGCFILLLFATALIYPKQLKLCFCLVGGIAVHLSADALAHLFKYDILPLTIIGLTQLIAFYFTCKQCISRGSLIGLISFVIIAWLCCQAELVLTYFILKMNPLTSFWFWVYPPALIGILGVLFYVIFSRTHLEMARTI